MDDRTSDAAQRPELRSEIGGAPLDEALATLLLTRGGHSAFLGMTYLDHGPDWFELALPWREDLVGIGDEGVLASGPIISLLDNCTSMAVWARRGVFAAQVTLDLRIDYLRAASPGKTVIARCDCYQLRRSMAFVRGIAHDGDAADPVAHVAGIFMLVGDDEWARK